MKPQIPLLLGLLVFFGQQLSLYEAFAPARVHARPRLCMAAAAVVSSSTPSQAECEAMGIREWPQQVKSKRWTEQAQEGTELTRYILEGQGTLVVDSSTKETLVPGKLITVSGPALLEWQASSADMILLTPGYEQGGVLLAVGGGLVLLVIALIVATSS